MLCSDGCRAGPPVLALEYVKLHFTRNEAGISAADPAEQTRTRDTRLIPRSCSEFPEGAELSVLLAEKSFSRQGSHDQTPMSRESDKHPGTGDRGSSRRRWAKELELT